MSKKEKECLLFYSRLVFGDCRYIKPQLPEIEADFPEFQFVEVDRDAYMDVAVEWNIFGIPSLVVIERRQRNLVV